MWRKFPDICLTVEGKPRKNLNQETNSTGDRTRARCVRSNDVTPGHSGKEVEEGDGRGRRGEKIGGGGMKPRKTRRSTVRYSRKQSPEEFVFDRQYEYD